MDEGVRESALGRLGDKVRRHHPARYLSVDGDGLVLEVGHTHRGRDLSVPTAAVVATLLDVLHAADTPVTTLRRHGSKGAPKAFHGAKDFERIAGCTAAPALRTLDVYGHAMTGDRIAALGGGGLQGIETLDLGTLDAAAVRALLDGAWPRLTSLTCAVPSVSDVLDILAAFVTLRRLEISFPGCEHANIGGPAAVALVQAPAFAQLETFRLRRWARDPQTWFAALAERSDLSLTSLEVGGGDVDVTPLLRSPVAQQLRELTGLTISHRNLDVVEEASLPAVERLQVSLIGQTLDAGRVAALLPETLRHLTVACDEHVARAILARELPLTTLELSEAYVVPFDQRLGAAIAEAPLDGLATLSMTARDPASVVGGLVGARLPGLRRFSLRGSVRGPAVDPHAVSTAPWLLGLRDLTLEQLGLVDVPDLDGAAVRRLSLASNALSHDALGRLADASMPSLEVLDLRYAPLPALDFPVMSRLLDEDARPRLRRLHAPSNPAKTKAQRSRLTDHPRVRISIG